MAKRKKIAKIKISKRAIFYASLAIVFLCLYFLFGKIENSRHEYARQFIQLTGEPAKSAEVWKTYENKQYKFTFQYPTEWTVNDYDSRIDVKAGTGGTSLTFYFKNDPDANGYDTLKTAGAETLKLNTQIVTFHTYTSTVTQQPSAYAYTSSVPIIGSYLQTINFYLDTKKTTSDLQIIKSILKSFVPAS
jgi:hypothetical protein